jgi:two-component system, cell cycle sensor histidine kinase and response regulator CckA
MEAMRRAQLGSSGPDPDRAEQRLQAVLQASLQGVLVHREERPLFVDETFARLLGYERPEQVLALDSVRWLVAEPAREPPPHPFLPRPACEAGPLEVQGRRRDGSPVWLDCRVSAVDWDGAPAVLVAAVDATARVEARLALEGERALVRAVMDAIPHRVFVKDAEARYVLVNEAFATVVGLPVTQIQGLHTGELSSAGLVPREVAAASDREVLQRGRSRVDAVERWAAPDGGPGYVRTIKTALHDAQGRVQGLVGISEDITAQRRTEAQAERDQARLIDAIESSPAAAFYLDAQGRVDVWNHKAIEFFPQLLPHMQRGVPMETVLRIVAPEAVGAGGDAQDWVRQRLNGPATGDPEAFELSTAAGRTLLVQQRRALSGGFSVIALDITERRAAEEALRKSQHLLQAVFETIPHFMFVKDAAARYLMVNQRFLAAWGAQPEQILGHTIAELTWRPEGERVRHAQSDQAVLSGALPRVETFIDVLFASGELRTIRNIKSPLRDDAGRIYGLVGISEDVTELERAQQALRDSQRLLKAVFDALPHLVFVKDEQARFLVVNRRFRDAFAVVPDRLIGKLSSELPLEPAHEQEAAAEGDRLILSGEQPRSDRVHTLRFADGALRTVRTIKEPLRDESGRIYGLVGIAEDISALHAAEAAAAQAHARLAGAVQHLEAAFYLYDRDEKLLLWNEKVYALFPELKGRLRPGLAFEAVLRMALPALDLASEQTEAQVRQRLAEFRSASGATSEQRLRDGRWVLVRDRRTADGGTVCLRYEVTELKRAEQALRDSEQRFRMLTENAPDVIFRYRLWPTRGFEYVSPVTTAITGYTPQEHYADPDLWLRITHPEDAARQAHLLRPDEESAGALVAVRWKYKNADWVWIEERCSPVFDEAGRQVCVEGVVRDISSRRELEDQLLQAQRMEAVGRLAGGIAHDFNNMLSVMGSYSAFVLEQLPEDAAAREDVKVIQGAVERSAALTRQLLAFSRKQMLQLETVELNGLVRQMEKMLRRVIGEDIALETRLQEGLGNVTADPGQIEQIVMNLAVNSRDAMPQGGTLALETRDVQVDAAMAGRRSDLKPGAYVMLAVSDSGVGMTPEVLSHIFEPFFTTKAVGEGTGLGLATVYGIVKQMSGDVSVTSQPGQGATFRILLPRSAAAGAPAAAPAPDAGEGGGSETILLVEDEEMVRNAARRILERYGYRVMPAASGAIAERISEELGEPIDLLLTDVVMPELSGPQLVQRLTAQRPRLKVLYMTGYTESTLAQHLGGGVQPEIVHKPFSPQALLRKVRRALGEAAH